MKYNKSKVRQSFSS